MPFNFTHPITNVPLIHIYTHRSENIKQTLLKMTSNINDRLKYWINNFHWGWNELDIIYLEMNVICIFIFFFVFNSEKQIFSYLCIKKNVTSHERRLSAIQHFFFVVLWWNWYIFFCILEGSFVFTAHIYYF